MFEKDQNVRMDVKILVRIYIKSQTRGRPAKFVSRRWQDARTIFLSRNNETRSHRIKISHEFSDLTERRDGKRVISRSKHE